MEKPILFNTAMVQAILEGKKTTTRRIVKGVRNLYFLGFNSDNYDATFSDKKLLNNATLKYKKQPYYVGDILYVRETWCDRWLPDDFLQGKDRYGYKADGIPSYGYWGNENQCKDNVWIPSIHMPKAAARIFLKVTDVRVERLQDITYDGLISEGIEIPRFATEEALQANFRNLWDSTLNKDQEDIYGWNANPWVWVIEFERIKRGMEQ